jgi:hypothetical protein
VDGEAGLVLLEEACRTADRLDKLDGLLAGSRADWVSLRSRRGRDDAVEVVVDAALVEARQQANVLRQLLAALQVKGAGPADESEAWLDGVSS